MQAIAVAPALPSLALPEQAAAQQSTSRPAAAPTPLAQAKADVVADPLPRFFSEARFAALTKLCDVLVPPLADNPGALQAGVPAFLDFHVGVSPADRQHLYQTGLDSLNARATKQFAKPFSALDTKQADAIVRPLFVTVVWPWDPPKDPTSHFLTSAHDDIRAATRNSREWADAAKAAGRRVAGAQQYWNLVDPVRKG